VRREIAAARINAKAEAIARLSRLFNQRLTQGRLMEPASDSARFYLTQLEQSDSAHPSTRLARLSFSQRLVEEARTAMDRGDLVAAQTYVTDARRLGVASSTIGAVEREIASARATPARYVETISAQRLERTRYVPPVYPQEAYQRGLSGSVELIFTVKSDGRTADINVESSTPPRVFDAAAVEAVEKWRYDAVHPILHHP
jgi:protein TonB